MNENYNQILGLMFSSLWNFTRYQNKPSSSIVCTSFYITRSHSVWSLAATSLRISLSNTTYSLQSIPVWAMLCGEKKKVFMSEAITKYKEWVIRAQYVNRSDSWGEANKCVRYISKAIYSTGPKDHINLNIDSDCPELHIYSFLPL